MFFLSLRRGHNLGTVAHLYGSTNRSRVRECSHGERKRGRTCHVQPGQVYPATTTWRFWAACEARGSREFQIPSGLNQVPHQIRRFRFDWYGLPMMFVRPRPLRVQPSIYDATSTQGDGQSLRIQFFSIVLLKPLTRSCIGLESIRWGIRSASHSWRTRVIQSGEGNI